MSASVPRPPHAFVPYPGAQYSSCVKCGFPKDHPVHQAVSA